jgi:endoglucanase
MVKSMNLGWNLGSTMQSHYNGKENEPEDYGGKKTEMFETSWYNPVTTQEIIDKVKEAGFNTLRVPVTWAPHMGGAPSYLIEKDWLDRVQEIVDYGYGIGMYVILDNHDDDRYWFIPDKKHEKAVTAQFKALWEQLCERFKNYDERLLFESCNEPRVVGSMLEWGGGTASQRAVLNRIHKVFVETVRGSGGNNATRWLLIPTYAASVEAVPMQALRLPDDDRLIVSVHGYEPMDFVSEKHRDNRVYTDKVRKKIDRMMGQIYRVFVAKGLPVYIGEFGVCDKENEAERAKYAKHYTEEAARYGMACAWWDEGYFPEYNEYFDPPMPIHWGLMDRRKLEWRFPAIIEALVEGSKNL